MSAHMIGDPWWSKGFDNTSTVHANRKDVPDGSYVCPTPDQANQCGSILSANGEAK